MLVSLLSMVAIVKLLIAAVDAIAYGNFNGMER